MDIFATLTQVQSEELKAEQVEMKFKETLNISFKTPPQTGVLRFEGITKGGNFKYFFTAGSKKHQMILSKQKLDESLLQVKGHCFGVMTKDKDGNLLDNELYWY